MQNEITTAAELLNNDGTLNQIGWARSQNLDCNLECAHFYALKAFQPFRVKRWDYYAVFTPQRFFSATVADLGYAGNIFVYTLDFETNELHEEGLVTPFGKDIQLPRNSTQGETVFKNDKATLRFDVHGKQRSVFVDWPSFQDGRGISVQLTLQELPEHESMNIVIPIGEKRFYYNRKINCMPVQGSLHYGDITENLDPQTSIGSLDWGRGVWEYSSFWNWASASGFFSNGDSIGLNLGCGFGDISRATENAVILNGKIHKLDQVPFVYDPHDFMKPWIFKDNEGRLDLTFTPFKERVATTKLLIIDSEVHQMFGHYNGFFITDEGKKVAIKDLVGFAEDHHARW
ncbi:MAG: hypothetical protein XD73_0833 [Anaerolinea thermophila]|uniref:DUF2804 domain-containing protein n=1 Tax=Anaerolinea thermophila TaxID=167964 RepID=A0A101FXW2_9CHLR|nr:MAG: hypothetical protein XD73_0833 [Anaerolinea thermophila]